MKRIYTKILDYDKNPVHNLYINKILVFYGKEIFEKLEEKRNV